MSKTPKPRSKNGGEVNHIKQLVPDPKNLRQHPERNIAVIEKSLEQVGAARSIVIDERNRVLAGNGVLEAAGNIGLERVRVVEADGHEIIAVRRRGLTEAQKQTLAIADNRASELSDWDVAALVGLDSSLTGDWFSDKELTALRQAAGLEQEVEEGPEAQMDRAAELQKKWGTKTGDLWIIPSKTAPERDYVRCKKCGHDIEV